MSLKYWFQSRKSLHARVAALATENAALKARNEFLETQLKMVMRLLVSGSMFAAVGGAAKGLAGRLFKGLLP